MIRASAQASSHYQWQSSSSSVQRGSPSRTPRRPSYESGYTRSSLGGTMGCGLAKKGLRSTALTTPGNSALYNAPEQKRVSGPAPTPSFGDTLAGFLAQRMASSTAMEHKPVMTTCYDTTLRMSAFYSLQHIFYQPNWFSANSGRKTRASTPLPRTQRPTQTK